MKIKTPADLKYWHNELQNSYFFTRKTMKFFGDTMANYRLIEHENCYELARKKPVLFNNKSSHYFDKLTLKVLVNKP